MEGEWPLPGQRVPHDPDPNLLTLGHGLQLDGSEVVAVLTENRVGHADKSVVVKAGDCVTQITGRWIRCADARERIFSPLTSLESERLYQYSNDWFIEPTTDVSEGEGAGALVSQDSLFNNCRVKIIPGKGVYLVATKDINAGDALSYDDDDARVSFMDDTSQTPSDIPILPNLHTVDPQRTAELSEMHRKGMREWAYITNWSNIVPEEIYTPDMFYETAFLCDAWAEDVLSDKSTLVSLNDNTILPSIQMAICGGFDEIVFLIGTEDTHEFMARVIERLAATAKKVCVPNNLDVKVLSVKYREVPEDVIREIKTAQCVLVFENEERDKETYFSGFVDAILRFTENSPFRPGCTIVFPQVPSTIGVGGVVDEVCSDNSYAWNYPALFRRYHAENTEKSFAMVVSGVSDTNARDRHTVQYTVVDSADFCRMAHSIELLDGIENRDSNEDDVRLVKVKVLCNLFTREYARGRRAREVWGRLACDLTPQAYLVILDALGSKPRSKNAVFFTNGRGTLPAVCSALMMIENQIIFCGGHLPHAWVSASLSLLYSAFGYTGTRAKVVRVGDMAYVRPWFAEHNATLQNRVIPGITTMLASKTKDIDFVAIDENCLNGEAAKRMLVEFEDNHPQLTTPNIRYLFTCGGNPEDPSMDITKPIQNNPHQLVTINRAISESAIKHIIYNDDSYELIRKARHYIPSQIIQRVPNYLERPIHTDDVDLDTEILEYSAAISPTDDSEPIYVIQGNRQKESPVSETLSVLPNYCIPDDHTTTKTRHQKLDTVYAWGSFDAFKSDALNTETRSRKHWDDFEKYLQTDVQKDVCLVHEKNENVKPLTKTTGSWRLRLFRIQESIGWAVLVFAFDGSARSGMTWIRNENNKLQLAPTTDIGTSVPEKDLFANPVSEESSPLPYMTLAQDWNDFDSEDEFDKWYVNRTIGSANGKEEESESFVPPNYKDFFTDFPTEPDRPLTSVETITKQLSDNVNGMVFQSNRDQLMTDLHRKAVELMSSIVKQFLSSEDPFQTIVSLLQHSFTDVTERLYLKYINAFWLIVDDVVFETIHRDSPLIPRFAFVMIQRFMFDITKEFYLSVAPNNQFATIEKFCNRIALYKSKLGLYKSKANFTESPFHKSTLDLPLFGTNGITMEDGQSEEAQMLKRFVLETSSISEEPTVSTVMMALQSFLPMSAPRLIFNPSSKVIVCETNQGENNPRNVVSNLFSQSITTMKHYWSLFLNVKLLNSLSEKSTEYETAFTEFRDDFRDKIAPHLTRLIRNSARGRLETEIGLNLAAITVLNLFGKVIDENQYALEEPTNELNLAFTTTDAIISQVDTQFIDQPIEHPISLESIDVPDEWLARLDLLPSLQELPELSALFDDPEQEKIFQMNQIENIDFDDYDFSEEQPIILSPSIDFNGVFAAPSEERALASQPRKIGKAKYVRIRQSKSSKGENYGVELASHNRMHAPYLFFYNLNKFKDPTRALEETKKFLISSDDFQHSLLYEGARFTTSAFEKDAFSRMPFLYFDHQIDKSEEVFEMLVNYLKRLVTIPDADDGAKVLMDFMRSTVWPRDRAVHAIARREYFYEKQKRLVEFVESASRTLNARRLRSMTEGNADTIETDTFLLAAAGEMMLNMVSFTSRMESSGSRTIALHFKRYIGDLEIRMRQTASDKTTIVIQSKNSRFSLRVNYASVQELLTPLQTDLKKLDKPEKKKGTSKEMVEQSSAQRNQTFMLLLNAYVQMFESSNEKRKQLAQKWKRVLIDSLQNRPYSGEQAIFEIRRYIAKKGKEADNTRLQMSNVRKSLVVFKVLSDMHVRNANNALLEYKHISDVNFNVPERVLQLPQFFKGDDVKQVTMKESLEMLVKMFGNRTNFIETDQATELINSVYANDFNQTAYFLKLFANTAKTETQPAHFVVLLISNTDAILEKLFVDEPKPTSETEITFERVEQNIVESQRYVKSTLFWARMSQWFLSLSGKYYANIRMNVASNAKISLDDLARYVRFYAQVERYVREHTIYGVKVLDPLRTDNLTTVGPFVAAQLAIVKVRRVIAKHEYAVRARCIAACGAYFSMASSPETKDEATIKSSCQITTSLMPENNQIVTATLQTIRKSMLPLLLDDVFISEEECVEAEARLTQEFLNAFIEMGDHTKNMLPAMRHYDAMNEVTHILLAMASLALQSKSTAVDSVVENIIRASYPFGLIGNRFENYIVVDNITELSPEVLSRSTEKIFSHRANYYSMHIRNMQVSKNEILVDCIQHDIYRNNVLYPGEQRDDPEDVRNAEAFANAVVRYYVGGQYTFMAKESLWFLMNIHSLIGPK